MKQELDFVHEGHNGERCAEELKHLRYVYVPEIHWDLTTKVRITIILVASVVEVILEVKHSGLASAKEDWIF